MRTNHIAALTGVRFFAALWVVLYHSTRHNMQLLENHHPGWVEAAWPVLGFGTRGVDLFFMLSGFVLTLNYLDQLGPRLDLAKAGRFIWLRLARVWPLYMVVLVGTSVLVAVRAMLWGTVHTKKLDALSFFQQTLMVQLWSHKQTAGSSVPGPAWSISAEWLAYLLFPLLALVVLRLHHQLRARALMVASALVLSPLVIQILAWHNLAGPYGWLARIVCEFVAGMLLCAGLNRLRLTERQRTAAGVLSVVLVAVIVACLYWAYHSPGHRWLGSFVMLLFLPLVGTLAVGKGPLVRLLASRTLVLGGGISYALYLVHSPGLYLYRDVTHYTGLAYLAPLPRYYGELVFIPVLVLAAWVLYRFVEEPARRSMRTMLAHQFPVTEHPLLPAYGEHRDRGARVDGELAVRSAAPAPEPLRAAGSRPSSSD